MPTYYFISDLHIGGDEALGVCDFEDELIDFLEKLAAKRDEDVELIIVGDAFGLWEFTKVDGADKLEVLIGQFPRIFETFRRTGKTIRITLLAGNHDYELACYPEFVKSLKAYNVHLEQTPSITRKLGKRRLWIEGTFSYAIVVFLAALLKTGVVAGIARAFSEAVTAGSIRDAIIGGALAAVLSPLVFGGLDLGKRWLRVPEG